MKCVGGNVEQKGKCEKWAGRAEQPEKRVREEISCGGEKVRRRDWEKGVKSEEKRRVFFWVVRWAYPALTNQAVYLDWIGDGEIVGVAVWW